MFGWSELTLIAILAIVLLGPDKLAELARSAGRVYAEYQKAKKRLELELLYGYKFDEFDEDIQKRKLKEIEEELREALNMDGSNGEG